ncbi:MAG: ABC transporter ATP-binding protein [Candidatus Thermoplasmatota archaeon]|nr:ABC transporter ATP-binding protein [Candidatus Thermoplasmatota archaeon]
MISKTVKCSKCGHETTINGESGERVILTCPKCNTKGKYVFPEKGKQAEKTSSPSAIEVHRLTKSFNGLKAVNNASFKVKKGEVFGFLGPNGAGKTTTIKAILGLIHPNTGQIKINGINTKDDSKSAKSYVGYLPEKVAFYDNLTALQNMYFYADMKHASRFECEPLLVEMGLEHAINKKVGKFSKGMQQRLGMARALLGSPPILILDEPSGGLDPRGVALIRKKIKEMKEKGSSVFVSSHILAEVQEVCDRVGIISKGVVVAEDSVDRLRDRLKLKPKLVLELESTSKKVVKAIKTLDGVDHVEVIGVMLHIECDPKSKSKIIIAVEKAGGNIINIQTMEPSLEEVFMRFTED